MLAKTKLHYKQDEPPLQQMSDQSKPQEGEGEDNRITLDNQSWTKEAPCIGCSLVVSCG